MPAPRGHKRYGGRRAGVPNKRTQNLFDKCEAKGIDLFEALLELCLDPDPQLRLHAIKEACQYLYPKRKALELTGEIDMRLMDRIKELEALPEAELKKLVGK